MPSDFNSVGLCKNACSNFPASILQITFREHSVLFAKWFVGGSVRQVRWAPYSCEGRAWAKPQKEKRNPSLTPPTQCRKSAAVNLTFGTHPRIVLKRQNRNNYACAVAWTNDACDANASFCKWWTPKLFLE